MSDSVLKETLGFQTEVSQLLKLMIHSLYSNKEIFQTLPTRAISFDLNHSRMLRSWVMMPILK